MPNLHGHGPSGRSVTSTQVVYLWDLELWGVAVLALALSLAALWMQPRRRGTRALAASATLLALGFWLGNGALAALFHSVSPREGLLLGILGCVTLNIKLVLGSRVPGALPSTRLEADG